jgi:GNAT superfamily N-acetyltransferase
VIEVRRTYLELTSPANLRPARLDDPGLRLERIRECPPDLYRFLYGAVGGPYSWIDRREWTEEEIRQHTSQPEVSVWVLYEKQHIAGYFELLKHKDEAVEIVYFGLVGEFLGRGLGKHLLTLAAECAWSLGARRVWLHTCTLDHPAALPNYLGRGFRPFKTETYTVELPPVAG